MLSRDGTKRYGGPMTRLWRYAIAAKLCASLAVALAGCNLKQKAGDKCTSIGKYICADATGALLCQNGTLVPLPCRGPKGCQGLGASSQCDDDLALEGDACLPTLNESYACSTDHKKELLCKDGKFATVSTCKGPKSCAIQGETVQCDDSMADVGDPCREEAGDANYGCTLDRKWEIVCKGGKFENSNSCRGVKGCWVDGNTVHCDLTFAREGDICRPVDNLSCGEDAKSEMKCSPQMKWVKRRDCKRAGCKIKGDEVYCD
jgi:hypothetical protein